MIYPIALCLAGLSTLTGCSSSDDDSESGLREALGKIAATDETRAWITFGDTSAIVKVTGKDWAKGHGFAPLRAVGIEQLAPYGQQSAAETGLALLDAKYAISAGGGSKLIGAIVGGQRGDRVSAALTKLGWRREGGRLIGPEIEAVTDSTGRQYALALGQLRIDGKDVSYGQHEANLADVGKPSGKSLKDDKRIYALAECLGDVVAAEIDGVGDAGPGRPTAIALGVRRPASDKTTPRAVVCLAWKNSKAADIFASTVSTELNTGVSSGGEKYSEFLRHPKVTKVGGDQNIVRWEADTPGDALAIMQMQARTDLPGLPK